MWWRLVGLRVWQREEGLGIKQTFLSGSAQTQHANVSGPLLRTGLPESALSAVC
jgi:hypothetical protein